MSNSTVKNILRMLDAQYSHIATRRTLSEREAQQAYYNGLFTAVNFILTDGYGSPDCVGIMIDCKGVHTLIRNDRR